MKAIVHSTPLRLLALTLALVLAGWGIREALQNPLPGNGGGQTQQALLVGGVVAAPLAVPALTALWNAARD